MPRGGYRPGSGRKPGAKTKKTREVAELIWATATITPLGYMQGLLDGTQEFDVVKFEAAKAAAPYVHARLAAIEHSGEIKKTYVARMPPKTPTMSEWREQHLTNPKTIQ